MMRKHRKMIAWLLALTCLLGLVGCSNKNADPTESTPVPTQTTAPAETEPQSTEDAQVLEGVTVETDASLEAVVREDTEAGMTLTSGNPAGAMEAIRLNKELDTVFGRYYEVVYTFTSNVAGTASLELGGLDKFHLTFTSITCQELKEDLSLYFLDVADQASGTMEMNGDGHLSTTFKAEEGWRVKLAVDRSLVAGKTYETTFAFTREGGKDQNVTYTVYDGAATILGSRTYWVENDVCVATFYLTANETVTKGTCLELGMLSGGEEASLTFTYIDFEEVDREKLEKLLAENPFPGVGAWTEGSLTPVTREDTESTMTMISTNAPGDWWKVKLEWPLAIEEGKTYEVTFWFTSDVSGTIKYHVGAATFLDSQEYNVTAGCNTFTVRFTAGAENYSCLELGGLGAFRLTFTGLGIQEVS